MSTLPRLLWLIFPLVLAGISNMVWMKLPFCKGWQVPMDQGKNWRDGRRIFGDNKTWKGFVGMIGVTAFWLQIFELLAKNFSWAADLSLIPFTTWALPLGWFYGAIWGLSYVLAELPNSFIKRRLQIEAGKAGAGIQGAVFKFVDQSDSVLGCLIGLLVFYIPSWGDALAIFFLATGFHFLTNLLLFMLGLKKQAG